MVFSLRKTEGFFGKDRVGRWKRSFENSRMQQHGYWQLWNYSVCEPREKSPCLHLDEATAGQMGSVTQGHVSSSPYLRVHVEIILSVCFHEQKRSLAERGNDSFYLKDDETGDAISDSLCSNSKTEITALKWWHKPTLALFFFKLVFQPP